MKKIIVTGGCGFIGSNFIINELKKTKNKILNLDLLTYAGNIKNLKTINNYENYSFVKGNIADYECVRSIFNNFAADILINFAAETHVDRSIDRPNDFINTNVIGTLNLLQCSRENFKKNRNFKFLHVSTDEVYGSLGKNGLFTENSPYLPNSPYSASKASSDHLVRAWGETYDLPFLITNCSNNYGPFQFPEKLIPLIIANCIDNKPLPIYGDGNNIRDWLYVSDHCSALSEVLKKGQIGETYNIGGNNEMTNIDIVTKICKILDQLRPRQDGSSYTELITFVEDRPGHDFRYAIDSSKIQNKLNWEPKETFETGILKTIKWYLDNEDWWRHIQKIEYKQNRLGLSFK
tara:strand:+ start:1280 stop:2326 length:1047 start_codon:yes stop_codon:yes gene_type:complete